MGTDGVLVEELDLDAQPFGSLREFVDLVDLPGFDGHVHGAGAFGRTVDVVPVEGGEDGVEVLVAEPQQRGQFVGPVGEPVAEAVGQRRLAEAPVAAAGAEGRGGGLEDDDPPPGVGLGGLECGPESGEAGTDDDEGGPPVAGQRRGVGGGVTCAALICAVL